MSDKVSKVSVNYRGARADAPKRCGTCQMYRARTCTLVIGDISPYAVCDKWEGRKPIGAPRGRPFERKAAA